MGSLERVALQVRQADLAYNATLNPPVFDLTGRWVELQSAMYARLRSLKLRLSDIKVESTTANPADVSVACWILDYGALVRYRLDRVEAWSNQAQVAAEEPVIRTIVGQAMAVLRDVSPNCHVTVQSTSVTVHGTMTGAGIAARIAHYVTKGPDGPPGVTPSGVSFLSEFPGGEGQGSVILERSAVVPDGALLRITSEHLGSLTETEVLDRAIAFFRSSTLGLGLDVDWGD